MALQTWPIVHKAVHAAVQIVLLTLCSRSGTSRLHLINLAGACGCRCGGGQLQEQHTRRGVGSSGL